MNAVCKAFLIATMTIGDSRSKVQAQTRTARGIIHRLPVIVVIKQHAIRIAMPIVFNVDKYAGTPADIDFNELAQTCRDLGVQPIGIRSCAAAEDAIQASGLPVLPASLGRGSAIAQEEPTVKRAAQPRSAPRSSRSTRPVARWRARLTRAPRSRRRRVR